MTGLGEAVGSGMGISLGRERVWGGVGGRLVPRAPVLPRLGFDEVDGAAVQVGHPAGDREAEAGAAAAVDLGQRPEPLECALAVRRRDAGTLVGDLEVPAVGRAPARDRRRSRRAGCAGTRCRAGWRRAGAAARGRPGPTRSGGRDAVRRTSRRDRRPAPRPRLPPATADLDVLHGRAAPCRRRRATRSSRSVTRAVIRSAWSSAARSVSGSGSATPSARFSSTAHRAASGVRSSWLTFATSSRRCRSTAASSSAIRLKARASSPTSSREVAVTRTEWSPRRHPPGGRGHLAQRRGHAHRQQLGNGERKGDRDGDAEPDRHATGGADRGDDGRHRDAGRDQQPELDLDRRDLVERSRRSSSASRSRARSRRRARCAPGRRRSWRATP